MLLMLQAAANECFLCEVEGKGHVQVFVAGNNHQ